MQKDKVNTTYCASIVKYSPINILTNYNKIYNSFNDINLLTSFVKKYIFFHNCSINDLDFVLISLNSCIFTKETHKDVQIYIW